MSFFDESEIISFTQRLVEIENGYIDINIIEFHHNYTVKDNVMGAFEFDYYPIAISYKYCTANQMQEISDKLMRKMDALNTDL